MWYESKVKYVRMDEDENVKTFNQNYLFEALSFTEAEARTYKEMEAYINTEFKVVNIKIENFGEIIPNNTAPENAWYKCKLRTITVDEEKGTEKYINSYVLVQANNIPDAHARLSEKLEDATHDFDIPSITLSPILDVFPYFDEDTTEEG